jgi:hypothetical protein
MRRRSQEEKPMRFLLPGMFAAIMLFGVSAVGSKAEAGVTPGIGTLPLQTKSYTPFEQAYYRRPYYRRGYYGYGYRPYYRPYGYYGYGYRPYGYYGYGRRWRY